MAIEQRDPSLAGSPTSLYQRFLKKLSSGPVALSLFIALVALLGSVNLLDFPLSVPYMRRISGFDYLDMQRFYTADQAYQLLNAFGAAGRETQFHLLFTIDILIPLVAGLAGFSVVAYLFRTPVRKSRRLYLFLWVPVAASLFDYLENGGIFLLLLAFPSRMDGVAQVTGMLTFTKSILYLATLTLMSAGLLRKVYSGARSAGGTPEDSVRGGDEK